MVAVEEVPATHHSDHQFQVCDSIVGLKSEHTMEDIEYQIHNNKVASKIQYLKYICHCLAFS